MSSPSPSPNTNVTPVATPSPSVAPAVAPVPAPSVAPVPAPSVAPVPAPSVAPIPSPSVTPAVTPSTNDAEQFFKNAGEFIVNATTVTIVFWILFIYFIITFVQGLYRPRNISTESAGLLTYSRTIDFICLILLIFGVIYIYKHMTSSENILGYILEQCYQFFNDPYTLLELVFFTIAFFIIVYILRVPMEPDLKPFFVALVENKIWIVYLIFVIIFFFKYVLGIQIVDILLNNKFVMYLETMPGFSTNTPASTPSAGIFNSMRNGLDKLTSDITGSPSSGPLTLATPAVTTVVTPVQTPTIPTQQDQPSTSDNQVFNIGNNIYTYKEAQAICNLFGADLANYDQIEGAYNGGAEWCNYGWSKDQMAFFPTQKSTWSSLQNDNKTKNACGRPGINGGYIANPNVRFGANCYGKKPAQPSNWSGNFIPPTSSSINPSYDVATQNNAKMNIVNKLQQMATNNMNGFNVKQWSRY